MKNFKKNYVQARDLQVDDHIKVAGILYRINQCWLVHDEVIIQVYNVRRPLFTGALTLNKKTLMKIWNQK